MPLQKTTHPQAGQNHSNRNNSLAAHNPISMSQPPHCIPHQLNPSIHPNLSLPSDPTSYFELIWSGNSFGNRAIANAVIGLELSSLPHPLHHTGPINESCWFKGLTLTISGASAGNGTFYRKDFYFLTFESNSAQLDFHRPLVGQPTGDLPWGTEDENGRGGSFNLYPGYLGSPTGTGCLTLVPAASADRMTRISFNPLPSLPKRFD